MSLAQKPEAASYKTFNEFFTRTLKAEVRPICAEPNTLVSPCDGKILEYGVCDDGTLLQAKGQRYSVEALLGEGNPAAKFFKKTYYMTIYLSPRDYHRVHMPVTGRLTTLIHHPGRLVSVAPYTLNVIPSLYARNERVVLIFDTKLGKLALVMVGAVNVGSVSVNKIGLITPQRHASKYHHCASMFPCKQDLYYTRSEEVANFNLGSTVVLLAANPDLVWCLDHSKEHQVNMGQKIADVKYQ